MNDSSAVWVVIIVLGVIVGLSGCVTTCSSNTAGSQNCVVWP